MNTSLSPIEGMSLLERAVHGDQYAWTLFVEEHTHLVTLWARRYRDALGLDGVEEAVIFAWARFAQAMTVSHFASFQVMAQVMGYLRTITVNICIDQVRALLAHNTPLVSLEALRETCGEYHEETHNSITQVEERDSFAGVACQILAELKTDQERAVFKIQFVLEQKSKDVLRQHADLFADIKAVYRAKATMVQRLRRNTELCAALGLKPLVKRAAKPRTKKTEQVTLLRAA